MERSNYMGFASIGVLDWPREDNAVNSQIKIKRTIGSHYLECAYIGVLGCPREDNVDIRML